MSNLLNDAIVDAKALREAALKNAEALVVDKYSTEVKETLNKLLEQEEEMPMDLGMDSPLDPDAVAEEPLEDPLDMEPIEPASESGVDISADEVVADVPFSATDNLAEQEGENLGQFPNAGEQVEVTVDLDALQEAVENLQNEQEIEINEEDLRALLEDDDDDDDDDDKSDGESTEYGSSGASQAAANAAETSAAGEQDRKSSYGGTNEELEITEEMIDDIVERLTVDMGATLSGWAGRSSESQKYQIERELAHRRSTDIEEELETLKKAQEELIFENKQLKESLKQYKQATEEIRENVHHVNLSNARLLYTNRVLRNTSLNERQKTKIADAISKAGSVTEAKTIYQTLENATPAATRHNPQSLSEAIGRRSTSVIRASRQESILSDPLAERMKKLAGIT